jgi:hypothetical protein
MRVIEPLAGAEFAPGNAGKRLVHCLSRSELPHAALHSQLFIKQTFCTMTIRSQLSWENKRKMIFDFDPTT